MKEAIEHLRRSDPVLGRIIEQVGDYKEVNLKAMGNFPFDETSDDVKQVPEIYRKLDGQKVLLTGEMFFPWMYEQVRALRPFRAVAEELAGPRDWPALYDADRLAANEVPVAAVRVEGGAEARWQAAAVAGVAP